MRTSFLLESNPWYNICMSQHHLSFLSSLFGENDIPRKKILRSIKAKADQKRTWAEKIADWMTSNFGSMTFLLVNATLFPVWLLVNSGQIDAISIFDPFPFVKQPHGEKKRIHQEKSHTAEIRCHPIGYFFCPGSLLVSLGLNTAEYFFPRDVVFSKQRG